MSIKTAAIKVLERNYARNLGATIPGQQSNSSTACCPKNVTPKENISGLSKALSNACRDLPIYPDEVSKRPGTKKVEARHESRINNETLSAFPLSLTYRRYMNQGIRPPTYNKPALCKNCGPVWLWFSDEVLGCPWCWNRATGKPIPRPQSVQCGDCRHFNRIKHPQLGHCVQGKTGNNC